MLCKNCGKEIGEGFIVCGYCGAKVDGQDSPENIVVGNRSNVDYQNFSKRKFKFLAFFFPSLWLLFHGLWDGFLISLLIFIAGGAIGLIPVVGWNINLIISLAKAVFVGANGYRYARLHRELGLTFIQIIKDPKLGF